MGEATLPDGLNGFCDERFAAVAELLARQLEAAEHHGIAAAAYFRGEPVLDLWGGSRHTPEGIAPWQEDTMAVCWSTTKGVAATALHIAMERHGVDYDAPIASVWPEFGTKGKEKITIRHALCHEAGVPQIRDVVTARDTLDWDTMIRAVEGLEPLWEPGEANGYHAIMYGWLVGETLRRIDGRDVPTFLAEELAGPLGLDGLHIGLPSSELVRVAPLIDPQAGVLESDEMYDQFLDPDGVSYKALAPRGGMFKVLNSPDGYQACIPAISGVFTARSLAKLYSAMERGGEIEGVRIMKPETVETATTVQSSRTDFVMNSDVGWRLGYMSGGSHIAVLGPNDASYGHVGAGGTYGAADPSAEVAFATVFDQWGMIEFLGGPRGVELSKTIVAAAEAAK
jgi:CubicO group peptidase (beta-lactamase class C family)